MTAQSTLIGESLMTLNEAIVIVVSAMRDHVALEMREIEACRVLEALVSTTPAEHD